jgi:hypothetical protein
MASLPGPPSSPPAYGSTGGILLVAGSGALAVASLLPWWHVGLPSATRIGFDLTTPVRGVSEWPGWIVLALAVAMAAAGVVILASPTIDRRGIGRLGGGAAIAALGVVLVAVAAPRWIVGAGPLDIRIGAGVLIAAAGAVVGGIGAGWLVREGSKPPPPPGPAFG